MGWWRRLIFRVGGTSKCHQHGKCVTEIEDFIVLLSNISPRPRRLFFVIPSFIHHPCNFLLQSLFSQLQWNGIRWSLYVLSHFFSAVVVVDYVSLPMLWRKCWESEWKRISEISPQRAVFPLLAVRTFLAHHANMSSEIGRESLLTLTVDFTFDEFWGVSAGLLFIFDACLRWGSLLFSPNEMWWVASQLVFLTFPPLHHQTQNFFFMLRFCIMSLREGN